MSLVSFDRIAKSGCCAILNGSSGARKVKGARLAAAVVADDMCIECSDKSPAVVVACCMELSG
jgi:hypothetical protein